jgi:hypothetical protein
VEKSRTELCRLINDWNYKNAFDMVIKSKPFYGRDNTRAKLSTVKASVVTTIKPLFQTLTTKINERERTSLIHTMANSESPV